MSYVPGYFGSPEQKAFEQGSNEAAVFIVASVATPFAAGYTPAAAAFAYDQGLTGAAYIYLRWQITAGTVSGIKELKEDQNNFEKYIASVRGNGVKKGSRPFKIPLDLKDVLTSPGKLPDFAVMQSRLKDLKQEFFENNFSEYIDIYKDNYAMIKHIYYFEKYLEPGKRRRFSNWCGEFNTVNTN
jgi:hypothetical protein